MKLVRSIALATVSLGLAACAGSAEPSSAAPEATGETSQAFVSYAYDGARVQVPGDPHIYLVDRGVRRWIPDPATFNSLFANWGGIQTAWWVAYMDLGPQISEGAYLAQATGDPAVYFVDSGVRRWITSPAAMAKYNFGWGNIHGNIPPSLLYSLPEGAPIE